MDTYETIVILKNNKHVKKEIKNITDIMQTFNSKKKVSVEEIGERNLAYKVCEHSTGYYVQYLYKAERDDVTKLEDEFRVNDNILKFISIKVDETDEKFELEDSESEQKKTKIVDALDIIYNL